MSAWGLAWSRFWGAAWGDVGGSVNAGFAGTPWEVVKRKRLIRRKSMIRAMLASRL